MTKTQKVKSFLQGKSFAGCSQAMAQFQAEFNETITYPQFNAIWRTELANNNFTVVEEPKVQTASNAGVLVVPEAEKEAIRFYLPSEIDEMFDESILVPFESGTILDSIISTQGGTLPATISMVPGASGVGKTSVLLSYLAKVKQKTDLKIAAENAAIMAANKGLKKGQEPAPLKKFMKLLFVSTEMNAIHMYKYQRRIKLSGLDIDILFLGQYDFPHDVLERALNEGYDIVLIDSFQDCVDRVVEAAGMGRGTAERWLLNLMDRTRLKGNKEGKYTSFLCTQHMTKGGTYTGSTRVKHMTDSMMELAFDENDQTYIEFNKNRDGSIRKRLYYKLTENGVEFDTKRFAKDAEIKNTIDNELARKQASADEFDKLLAQGVTVQGSVVTNEEEVEQEA